MKPSAASRAVFLGGLFDQQTAAEDKAEEEQKAIEREARRDPLGKKLVELGYLRDEDDYYGDLGDGWGSNKDFALPWRLPSRLFQFPMHYRRREGGPGNVYISHPLLVDHPLVKRVCEAAGTEPVYDEEGDFSFETTNGQWHHAIDLMTAGHWRSLLNTRQFTTGKAILSALALKLTYSDNKVPEMSVSDGRRLLAEMGVLEPPLRTGWAAFSQPHENNYEGQKSVPINANLDDKGAEAWAIIHGIEDGVFKFNRGVFLNWTPAGMLRWREEQNATETA